jgi:hypothetical protein
MISFDEWTMGLQTMKPTGISRPSSSWLKRWRAQIREVRILADLKLISHSYITHRSADVSAVFLHPNPVLKY